MKTILIIITSILMTACAHQTTKTVTKIETVPKSTNEEVNNVPKITIDFPSTEGAVGDYSANDPVPVCKDEHLYFLIKYPFVGLNSLKEVYDATLVYNEDLNKLIELTISARRGDISMNDFMSESNEINEEMKTLNDDTGELFSQYAQIEAGTQALYGMCSSRMEEMMTAKKLDTNQDGCELEQQKSYILDPYSVKSAIQDGMNVEFQIREKLNNLYRIIFDEAQQKTTLENAQQQFAQEVNVLNESGLLKKSTESLDKIVNSFQSTMNVKEQCEKNSKKSSK